MAEPVKICFVCLGNICRSPLAEGVFTHLVAQKGLQDRFTIDSAGTSGWHEGEPADERMRITAMKKGIQLTSRARQFLGSDFDRFDLVLAMDHSNLSRLRQLKPAMDLAEKLFLFRSFDPQANGNLEVPDPYYGGDEGFENVFEIVRRTCPKILDYAASRFPLTP